MPACELPTRPSLFLADCGELALRVRGREHDGKLIRLRSPKCTIGSAPGCTLRLRGAGVAPLHCWVLRGQSGTIIRRLHGPLNLNGGACQESPLSPGDRLRVGSVELEVVECNQRPADAPPELFAVPPVDTAELERELTAAMEKIKRLEGESRQGWQSSITAADRADQLRTALADAHQQLEDACRELSATQATMQRQSGELHELRSALTSAEQNDDERAELASRMELETAALRDEQARCLTELNDLRAALAGALDERSRLTSLALENEQRLATEQERWQTEQKRLQAEQELLQRRLNQRDAELSAVREESQTQTGAMTIQMDQLRRTVDMSQSQWETKCVVLEQQLAARQAELATAQQAREQDRQTFEQERRGFGEQLQAFERERQTNERERHAVERERQAFAAERQAHQDELLALESQQRQLDEERRAKSRLELEVAEHRAAFEGQLTQLQQQLDEKQQALTAATNRLQEADVVNARCEQLQSKLLSAHQDLQSLNDQMTALAANAGCQDDVARQVAELTQQRQLLDERTAALAAEQQAATSQLHERAQHLEQQAAELERNLEAANARLTELDTLRAQLAADRDALGERAQQLAEREQQIAACASESPIVTQPFAAIEPSADESQAIRAQELEQQLAAAEAGRRNLAEQVETLELRCRELEEQRGAALAQAAAAYRDAVVSSADVQPVAEESDAPIHMTAPFQPQEAQAEQEQPADGERVRDSAQVESVLGRLVRSGVWREEKPAEIEGPAAEAPPPEVAAPASRLAAAEHGDDESIDNYMDRLLKRVRGESATDAGGWKKNQIPDGSAPAAPAVQTAPAMSPPVHPEPEGEYVPRTTAPEQTLGLSAMRDVANTAARTAIETHIRKHTGQQAIGRLVTAVLILLVSVAGGYSAWHAHSFPAGVVGAFGVALGLFWTLAAIRRITTVMRLNRPRPEVASPISPVALVAPLPPAASAAPVESAAPASPAEAK